MEIGKPSQLSFEIDFELFDDEVEQSVSAFLDMVRGGEMDNWFFHRLTQNELAGGTFGLNQADFGSLTQSAKLFMLDSTTLPVEPGRENTVGTIALERTEDGESVQVPNLIVNLEDNVDADSVVIGRLTDSSLDRLQFELQAANTFDVDEQFTGADGSTFDLVPFLGTLAPSTLLKVGDVEIIKTSGAKSAFTQALFHPEGFASASARERMSLAAPSGGEAVDYQVIVHYEFGTRDEVIATGSLAPGERRDIELSDGSDPTDDLVRRGVAYGIEVMSTGPIAGQVVRSDFGAINSARLVAGTPVSSFESFPAVQIGPGIRQFLVWQSRSDDEQSLTVTLTSPDGDTELELQRLLQPRRRGGLVLHSLGLPEGTYTAQISTSAGPGIVAGLSHYEPQSQRGFTILSRTGALEEFSAAVRSGSELTERDAVQIVDPNDSAMAALARPVSAGGQEFQWGFLPSELIDSEGALEIDSLPGFEPAENASFVIDREGSALHEGEGFLLSSSLTNATATSLGFSSVHLDPALAGTEVFQGLTIFRFATPADGGFDLPNAADTMPEDVLIQLHFDDGSELGFTRTLGRGDVTSLEFDRMQAVLDHIAGGPDRESFWVEITSEAKLVAELWSIDLAGTDGFSPGGYSVLGSDMT